MSKVDYGSLLESAKEDRTKTEMYIKTRQCTLEHSRELLKQKEEELNRVTEYVYILQNVVQGIKFAISTCEKEIEALNSQLEASVGYQGSLEETKDKLDKNLVKVESGSFRTEAKKPRLDIQLQSITEAVKDAEKLSLSAEDTESKGPSVGKVIERKKEKLTEGKEAQKLVEEREAALMETYADMIKPAELTEAEKDNQYIEKVKSSCKAPAEKDLKEIWIRRVLVKHYMESGMSQVRPIVERFNRYASQYGVKLGSESSISKDMARIVDGKFNLEMRMGKEAAKEVYLKFRPASMLTSAEISQLSGVIASMEKRYKGKNSYIKQYVEKYARTNLENMSSYKVRAVNSYVSEQMSE